MIGWGRPLKSKFCIKWTFPCPGRVLKKAKKLLENVAIANALQLEAARATPALFRFNYDAMPSLKSLNLSIAVL